MITKPKDKLYCGVREESIKNASPILNKDILQHLWNWISERYSIHIKKDVEKLDKPWSDSEIFQSIKFTQVRREHDRETRNLINDIAHKYERPLMDRMFNIMMSRYWNKHQSWLYATEGEIVEFPLGPKTLNKMLNNVANTDKKYPFYSGAYYTTSARHYMKWRYQDRIDSGEAIFAQSPIYVLTDIGTEEFFNKLISSNDQLEFYQNLRSIYGVGEFVAYQWFVDFTYMDDFPFSENEFTIAGPGCKKGLDMLFADKDGMTYEECLFWLRDNQDNIFSPLGYSRDMFSDLPEHDRLLNVMSLENCFCELQKYMKCIRLIEEGKPPSGKNRYDGKSDKYILF